MVAASNTLEEHPMPYNGLVFSSFPIDYDNSFRFDMDNNGHDEIVIDENGKVTLSPGLTPDKASKLFWKAVEHNFPCRCSE